MTRASCGCVVENHEDLFDVVYGIEQVGADGYSSGEVQAVYCLRCATKMLQERECVSITRQKI